jgi:1-acyl-sn-glycerol-3-phosphate acyltransferase
VLRGWKYGLQLVSLGYLFVGGVVVTLVAPLVRVALGRREGVGAEWVAGLFRGFVAWLEWAGLFEVRYEGVERLRELRGVIVAANHPGLLDAVFLISRVPRAVCIMRAGLMRNWAFAGCAGLADYVTNDRGAESIRRCRERLAAGENLLIFPEGTRTRAGARGVNRFKTGFALTSVSSGVPIHTVLIERSGSYLSKEVGLLGPAEVPVRMSIRVGEVFEPREGETAKELAARLERYFREQLDRRVGS